MKQVAYYKGCLASLSAKELDTSTKALAPKVGYEGIVQGEHSLAKLDHHLREEGEVPPSEGSVGGMGSLTSADVTPGEEPTAGKAD